MIIDRIEHIDRYGGFIQDADRLAEFFRKHPVGSLGMGEYAVDGTDYVVTPTPMEPKPADAKGWEGHRAHTDIHLTLKGRECLRWIPLSRLKTPKSYNEQADVEFYADDAEGTLLCVEEGYFVIFLPEDYHKPLMDIPSSRLRLLKAFIEKGGSKPFSKMLYFGMK